MSQIEVTKIIKFVGVEPPSGHAAAPKIVMYAMGMPGESSGSSNKQGHVHAQIIRRD